MTQTNQTSNGTALATFAGGCFWCAEAAFELHKGVVKATAGYTGGTLANPTYEEVSTGTTGHYEAVQVRYDPHIITYGQLLDIFWMNIDPQDDQGQFADKGSQYKTAIFYHDAKQKEMAERSKATLEATGKFDTVVTNILPASKFWPAEKYHQHYSTNNPLRYKLYKKASGREGFLKKTWNNNLTPLQLYVTQHNGTEPAFLNKYWDNHEEGIYVDAISGKPLFSSTDKYDSGTGWPSFTKPIDEHAIIEQKDESLAVVRMEVRSDTSHLGHVFNDGPANAGGQRYCMNSAALRFVPKDEMEVEGYGEYLYLFAE